VGQKGTRVGVVTEEPYSLAYKGENYSDRTPPGIAKPGDYPRGNKEKYAKTPREEGRR